MLTNNERIVLFCVCHMGGECKKSLISDVYKARTHGELSPKVIRNACKTLDAKKMITQESRNVIPEELERRHKHMKFVVITDKGLRALHHDMTHWFTLWGVNI